MMQRGVLITGTDTGCGKTLVSLGLMALLQQQGYTVLGMKPVASGCQRDAQSGGLINADARALQMQGSRPVAYASVNPVALAAPIAPQLAASQSGRVIEPHQLHTAYRQLQQQADWVVVEGIGGWRVPLTDTVAVSDLPQLFGIPVIVTVGLRLGCINHALLTLERMGADQTPLLGWVGNHCDPDMAASADTGALLQHILPAPCLGVVPWLPNPTAATVAQQLDHAAVLSALAASPPPATGTCYAHYSK